MADPVSLQTVLTYLTLISIPVGVFYHIMTLNNTKKTQQITIDTRRTRIFLQIYGTITPEQVKRVNEILSWEWDDYDDFTAKYWDDIDARSKIISVLERFNGIGLLAEKNQVDLDLAYKLMNVVSIAVWNKFEGVIKNRREILQRTERFAGVEFLYDEMMKRRRETSTTM